MKKVLMILILGLVFTAAYAEESYTISGDVKFRENGDIYICLYTSEEFREYPKHELSTPPCKFIKMNADLKKKGTVSFKFDNVQKGVYGLFTFQDINENKMVDLENYCPKEPWGSYKEQDTPGFCPNWSEINFHLEKDIKGIKIKM